MRGYIPMVGDLFHVGHINLVRSVRERGYDVVVGVHSDAEVEGYRLAPVMTLDERVAAVQACKYVAEVIPAALTIIDEETERFMHGVYHRATGPIIKQLREQWHDVREQEVDKLFSKLS